jgi:hypothetical protein
MTSTSKGYEFEPEAIAELIPYLTQHVNRFGRYHLDLERQPQTLHDDSLILIRPPQDALE